MLFASLSDIRANCFHSLAICLGALLFLTITACSGDGSTATIEALTVIQSARVGGGNGSSDSDSGPCASYVDRSGNRISGIQSAGNCVYDANFVSETNPLTTDVTIEAFSGVHIFQATLQVGIDSDAGIIPEGPTLTIEAGSTLVWTSAADYLLVTRGAKIVAEGSPIAPITLTAYEDAVSKSAHPFATQLWGGVVINGSGVTNKCSNAQRAENACHVLAEGKPSHYGGRNNADNSGVLRYVVIKYPGFEVAPGDELNGLTLNAVGSTTVVENVQVYSAYDDGVEFFGGAVNVNNFVALYVRDDSIDYADGWIGTISNALLIHQERDGNRCIEGDNQGNAHDAAPTTNPRVSNVTCITSGNDEGTHGDSEGILLRRGVNSQIANSIVYDGYSANGGNECLELDDSATREAAATGATTIKSSLIACTEPTKDDLSNGDSVRTWLLNSNGRYANNSHNVILDSSSLDIVVLDGSKGFFTANEMQDAYGNRVSVQSTNGLPIGAVTANNDWTEGWTVCLEPRSANPCGLYFL